MTTKADDLTPDSNSKPSKQALLDELETIRTSLMPEDGAEHSDEEPIQLTEADMVIESDFESELDATREMPIIETGAPDENLDFELDIPDSDDESEPTQEQENPVHVLPGQQSLFEEKGSSKDKSSNEDNNLSQGKDSPSREQTPDRSTKVTPDKADKTEAAAENPFLPRHIKQKLEKEKSLYQQQLNEATPIQPTSAQRLAASKKIDAESGATPVTTTPATTPTSTDTLIDELVDEHLPQIEQELRRRLRARLGDDAAE